MKSLTLGFSASNWPVFILADNLYILHLVSSNIKDVYSWWVECCVQWVVTSRRRLWTLESMEQRRVRRTRLHTLSAHHRSLQPTEDDESRLAHVSTDLFDLEMTSRTGDDVTCCIFISDYCVWASVMALTHTVTPRDDDVFHAAAAVFSLCSSLIYSVTFRSLTCLMFAFVYRMAQKVPSRFWLSTHIIVLCLIFGHPIPGEGSPKWLNFLSQIWLVLLILHNLGRLINHNTVVQTYVTRGN